MAGDEPVPYLNGEVPVTAETAPRGAEVSELTKDSNGQATKEPIHCDAIVSLKPFLMFETCTDLFTFQSRWLAGDSAA